MEEDILQMCLTHFFSIFLGALKNCQLKQNSSLQKETAKLWESEPVCDVPGLLHQPLKEIHSNSYLLLTTASLNIGCSSCPIKTNTWVLPTQFEIYF